MNHSALWYFEHFGLLHGLSEEQKQEVESAEGPIAVIWVNHVDRECGPC